jgi:hypothetical protein
VAGGIAVALCTAHGLFGIIDVRMFLHYPIFIAGILANRIGILSSRRIGGALALITLPVCIGSYVAYKTLWLLPVQNQYCGAWFCECAPSLALIATMMASGVMFWLWASSQLRTRMSKRTRGLVLFLSIGSYGTYLYHRPLFSFAAWCLESMGNQRSAIRIATYTILLVAALFVGYGIQSLEKRIMQRVIKDRTRPAGTATQ